MSLHHRSRVTNRHVHVHVDVHVGVLKKVEGVSVVEHDDDDGLRIFEKNKI